MQIVINTPGTFITQKDECFRLKQKEKVFDISPLKVESIVISNQAMISSQAVVQALEHNIDIIFLDSYGDPIGRIWFSKMGSTALIRRKQLEAATNHIGIKLVVDMIQQKMENQIRFLKKLMHVRPGKESLFTTAVKIIEKSLSGVNTIDQDIENVRNRFMGLEGTAGRAYFQCLSKIMPERYQFHSKSIKRFKQRIRDLACLSCGRIIEQIITQLNIYLRGCLGVRTV